MLYSIRELKKKLTMQISENKVKFSMGNMRLISKVIDGKFPDYKKVVPSGNDKVLLVESKDFINSIERGYKCFTRSKGRCKIVNSEG